MFTKKQEVFFFFIIKMIIVVSLKILDVKCRIKTKCTHIIAGKQALCGNRSIVTEIVGNA